MARDQARCGPIRLPVSYERMFDTASDLQTSRRKVDADVLAVLAERARPVTTSRAQVLPVIPPLRGFFPDGGLRRGTTVSVSADAAGGATLLALALVAAASAAGSWCVAVGLPTLGGLAADQMTLDLDHLVFVPWPGGQLAETVAALLDGVDVVLLRPPPHLRSGVARRLVARLRDRRAVLVVLTSGTAWPDRSDIELRVENAHWVGVGPGDGCLRSRLATVTTSGRRASNQRQHRQLWLPAESRAVEIA